MASRISFKRLDLSESLSTHQMTNTAAPKTAKITTAADQPYTSTPPTPDAVVATAPPNLFTETTLALP